MAPPTEPPTEITVRVKVPPGHIAGSSADEFSLGTVSTSSHIGDLRQQIQQLLPSNPSPDRQRLLFAGRALVDNEQTLANALNTRRDTSQIEYVIHLLVKGEQDSNGGIGNASRGSVSTSGSGRGLLSAALHPEQGEAPRLPGQPGNAAPSGPPHLPPGVPQPPYNLQQAQHLALLQQRQMQQRLQMNRQPIHPPFAIPPQVQQGRMMPGAPPANMLNPFQMGPGQPPHPHGINAQQPAMSNRDNAQDASGEAGNQETSARDPDSQQAQPQGPHRPLSGQGFHVQGVGPDGNRFEIRQHTLNIPFPPHQGPPGVMPGIGLPFPLPGMAQQPRPTAPGQPPSGPSALDRARQNVAEMRQMVDDMRNSNATEEDRARTARLQEHIQAVNDYIDPFGVGRPNPPSRSASPFPQRMAQSMRSTPNLGLPPFAPPPRAQPAANVPPFVRNTMQPPSSNQDTTCYLLSSPQGPQALLFSPQHGTYTGSLQHGAGLAANGAPQPGFHRVMPMLDADRQHGGTPTQQPGAEQGQVQEGQPADAAGADPAVIAAQQVAQQLNQAQQAQARPPAQENPLGPMQPILAHFWLLLRVMIFAYFVLGTNMGWRRPVALALIGLGFWMIRAGLFGEGGLARRWWDGIMRVEQAPQQQAQAQGGQGEQRPGQLPTPEELAQRLMQDRQEALQRAPLHRLREHVRPLERAAALFLASFWPGVGEAHVRAQEAEERRRAEEEVERRRREEEERQRAIEAEHESEKKEGSAEGGQAEGGEAAVSEKAAMERSAAESEGVRGGENPLPADAGRAQE